MRPWWPCGGSGALKLSEIADEARIAVGSIADLAGELATPSVRLGVTGLSRSGKTVFITALVHNLIHGGRLPLFRPMADGRIIRAYLAPQPDDDVPRFAIEDRVASFSGPDRHWPAGTTTISELRIVIEYEPVGLIARLARRGRLAIDIVDYPGEWLLDLPLLAMDYGQWSRETLAMSREAPRAALAGRWHGLVDTIDAAAPADEAVAIEAAARFTEYLRACRDDPSMPSTVPPGRFVMPGDLAGSPALTFAPLDPPAGGGASRRSLWALMERRFEAYKRIVVRPFFRDHFARIDRQIVLVDALAALSAGHAALADLERTLAGILTVFRPGRRSVLSTLLRPRIDRVMFAATKADHLHHTSHDRLGTLLGHLTARAGSRAAAAGAEMATIALASVRATREATVARGGDDIACIVGVPEKGERIGGREFDGTEETAIFPGDLPEDPAEALGAGFAGRERFGFVRFRPPPLTPGPAGRPVLPNIRLDRALDFLLADGFA